jgi:hypothetical protein
MCQTRNLQPRYEISTADYTVTSIYPSEDRYKVEAAVADQRYACIQLQNSPSSVEALLNFIDHSEKH